MLYLKPHYAFNINQNLQTDTFKTCYIIPRLKQDLFFFKILKRIVDMFYNFYKYYKQAVLRFVISFRAYCMLCSQSFFWSSSFPSSLKGIIQQLFWNSMVPSVGSCHHGMARPLGCGWGSRPPDMEVSCEYIE